MDYFYNFSDDWSGNIKIKIKVSGLNIFLNKKILIYGLGKSGIAAFKFLKNKSDIFLYDDYQKNLISAKQIKKLKFDVIIISPGIDINKCKLSKFLKKSLPIKKIYTCYCENNKCKFRKPNSGM